MRFRQGTRSVGWTIWDPVPARGGPAALKCAGGEKGSRGEVEMGGIPVPSLLVEEVTPGSFRVKDDVYRDPFNNILVLWSVVGPSDSSSCWVYYARFGSWQISYP